MAFAAMPAASSKSVSTMNPERCGEVDIDASPFLTQTVPINCLLATGAYSIATMVGKGARVAIACPYATFIVYLVESLSFLSRNIKARDPFAWARFELGVAFGYTLFFSIVALVWTGTAGTTSPQFFYEAYSSVTEHARANSRVFGVSKQGLTSLLQASSSSASFATTQLLIYCDLLLIQRSGPQFGRPTSRSTSTRRLPRGRMPPWPSGTRGKVHS